MNAKPRSGVKLCCACVLSCVSGGSRGVPQNTPFVGCLRVHLVYVCANMTTYTAAHTGDTQKPH